MSTFVVEPRDTMVLRDGRPFLTGATTGRTLTMPWPSSIAGLARTRVGSDAQGRFEVGRAASLLETVAVKGPWLVRLGTSGEPEESFFPAPLDALWHREPTADARAPAARRKLRYRLRPSPTPPGVLHDLEQHALELVRAPSDLPKSKPDAGPSFYGWTAMEAWLSGRCPDGPVDGAHTFLDSFDRERRVHVAVSPETGTAEDGQLFSTDGVRFTARSADGSFARYAVAFWCDSPDLQARGGLVVLGGERRASFLRASKAELPRRPSFDLANARRLRIVLATPAIFSTGAVPETIRGAKVVAACVGRPEVISGWDFEKRAPKPTRRMAPAGSVYWIELPEGRDAAEYVDEVWMNSICENAQDRRDGFGLALVGVA